MRRVSLAGWMGVLIAAALVSAAFAQEHPAAKPEAGAPAAEKAAVAKDLPPLTDMTLKGTIEKVEKPGKDGKPKASYVLKDAAGMPVRLPPPPEGVNLEDFVGAQVTVTGKGMEMDIQGKKIVRLKEIVKIEKAPAGEGAAQPPKAQ